MTGPQRLGQLLPVTPPHPGARWPSLRVVPGSPGGAGGGAKTQQSPELLVVGRNVGPLRLGDKNHPTTGTTVDKSLEELPFLERRTITADRRAEHTDVRCTLSPEDSILTQKLPSN